MNKYIINTFLVKEEMGTISYPRKQVSCYIVLNNKLINLYEYNTEGVDGKNFKKLRIKNTEYLIEMITGKKGYSQFWNKYYEDTTEKEIAHNSMSYNSYFNPTKNNFLHSSIENINKEEEILHSISNKLKEYFQIDIDFNLIEDSLLSETNETVLKLNNDIDLNNYYFVQKKEHNVKNTFSEKLYEWNKGIYMKYGKYNAVLDIIENNCQELYTYNTMITSRQHSVFDNYKKTYLGMRKTENDALLNKQVGVELINKYNEICVDLNNLISKDGLEIFVTTFEYLTQEIKVFNNYGENLSFEQKIHKDYRLSTTITKLKRLFELSNNVLGINKLNDLNIILKHLFGEKEDMFKKTNISLENLEISNEEERKQILLYINNDIDIMEKG